MPLFGKKKATASASGSTLGEGWGIRAKVAPTGTPLKGASCHAKNISLATLLCQGCKKSGRAGVSYENCGNADLTTLPCVKFKGYMVCGNVAMYL